MRQQAYELKLKHRGPKVYFRGLIEISNKCRKNCLYCGIRSGNCNVCRYEMSDDEVLREAQFALDAGYGSIAIQGGERCDSAFVERITRLLHKIRALRRGGDLTPDTISQGGESLGITLSLGEQSREVYREWKRAGATRYLLRIEASNRELYEKIHPAESCDKRGLAVNNCLHSYDMRINALENLKSEGYLLGSGIMIGLPFQTYSHLEEDLQFLKKIDVDMVGMGPYIPHKDTPLGKMVLAWRGGERVYREGDFPPPEGDFWNFSNEQLLDLSIDMVAKLRILMPDINIAATTALQVLHPQGREMALLAGANVIMPNMTEVSYRGKYSLYEGKQGVADDALATKDLLLENLSELKIPVGWNQRGDRR